MPIGDPVTQTIPAVASAGTSYATQIVAFLQEIKARMEAKVALTSLLAGLFDLSNNGIANARYVGLYEQVALPTTPIGSFQRYGGEAYYVGAAGAVRITNGGSLDVVSANGITGNYAAPAEFKYVLADTAYQALSNTGTTPATWAYLDSRGVDIYGGATSVERVRITWTAGLSYALKLPPALPAATSVMVMAPSGDITVPQSNVALPSNCNVTLSGTGDTKHGDNILLVPIGSNAVYSIGLSGNSTTLCFEITGGGRVVVDVPQLRVGWRIKSIKVYGAQGGGTPGEPASIAVKTQKFLNNTTQVITSSGTFGGGGARTLLLTTPFVVTSDYDRVMLDMTVGTATTVLGVMAVTYDIP